MCENFESLYYKDLLIKYIKEEKIMTRNLYMIFFPTTNSIHLLSFGLFNVYICRIILIIFFLMTMRTQYGHWRY